MKKCFLLLTLLFCLSITSYSQSKAKELQVLREETNLADDEIIRVNKEIKFPAKKTLKVMLAIKDNSSNANNLEKWIEKWNRKNGKKHGNIELVNEPSKAEIIVAQFRTVKGKYIKESSVKVGNISNTGKILPKARVSSDYGYRRLTLPIYSYLMVRSNGFWTIVFQNVEPIFVEQQTVNPYTRLRGALKKRLKRR